MRLRLRWVVVMLFYSSVIAFSQEVDRVYLKDKNVVKGKVLKVDDSNIEINPEGDKPFLIVKRSSVTAIVYADNTVVTFEKENKNKTVPSSLVDERDGKSYKVGKIGKTIWMLENLNYSVEGSKCYKNDYKYCEQFGRLYTYGQACEACPKGWRMPTYDEWNELEKVIANEYEKTIPYSDGSWARTVGKALKSKKDWNRSERGGYNAYNFNAIPSGEYGYNSEKKRTQFFNIGRKVSWLGQYKGDNDYSIASISNGRFSVWNYNSESNRYISLRCVKD